MARAVLGPLIQDLRGRIGNQVFDNYKGIHIVRSLPTVTTNPQSSAQSLVRAALAQFVLAWRGLTLAEKQLWEQVATELIRGKESDARMNRGGLISLPRGPFSGYNAFIAFNLNRYTYGYSALTDVLTAAPIESPLPEPLQSFSASVSGRTITAAWEYITPGPLQARLGIWIKSISAGVHPQMIYTEARNANGSTNITQARKTSGITVDLPNGVYQLQAIIVDKNGRTTAPSELVFVQIGDVDMFTYFSARQQVLNLDNQSAAIPATTLDLSAQIPAGAHSAIVLAQITQVTAGTTGQAILRVRRDATQGDAIVQERTRSGLIPRLVSDGAVIAITPARSIVYEMDYAADAEYDVDIYLLGYIS